MDPPPSASASERNRSLQNITPTAFVITSESRRSHKYRLDTSLRQLDVVDAGCEPGKGPTLRSVWKFLPPVDGGGFLLYTKWRLMIWWRGL